MRYRVLATDYDGTLAHDGRVNGPTAAAVARVRASGRRLVLVTGRVRIDLQRVFPEVDLFDFVVAENGGTLWQPHGEERALARPPPPAFVDWLRAHSVPVEVGMVVVATTEPHDRQVLRAIHELGLDLQLVFNKGAVMVLPPGVTKASGLDAALEAVGLTRHEVVAVGDAENDVAMLAASECGVAVDNALPAVKRAADHVARGARGAGVVELAEALLTDDLRAVDPPRHHIPLGTSAAGPVALSPARAHVLLAGADATGRIAVANAILAQLVARAYQLCVIDVPGDSRAVPGIASIGTAERPPEVEEAASLLASSRTSLAVRLGALAPTERKGFLTRVGQRLRELRSRTGRPHWIAVDGAHHLLPGEVDDLARLLLPCAGGLLVATAQADQVSEALRRSVNVVISVGMDAPSTVPGAALAQPSPSPDTIGRSVVLWRRGEGAVRVRLSTGGDAP